MAVNSKQLKENGTQFYPETHVEVVVDGDGNYLNTVLGQKEATSNKVTSLSSNSTDTQYPSAKCVYDLLGDVESLINAL